MDVLYMGGTDPWSSVHNSKYPLVYKNIRFFITITKILIAILLW